MNTTESASISSVCTKPWAPQAPPSRRRVQRGRAFDGCYPDRVPAKCPPLGVTKERRPARIRVGHLDLIDPRYRHRGARLIRESHCSPDIHANGTDSRKNVHGRFHGFSP